ncbi:MAG TPA: metalloregulator ArsR/SmtB family transcription factor [Thermoanaerobaculia bacterium]|nr:metalloregulator ArsR/SmtB family transcription factor [Thermoanaerobaculia bacterium]
MSARRNRRAEAASFEDTAPVFAALGDQRRLRLVARLGREGPLSISRLSDGAGVTRQAVAKHLRVLAGAGLARGVRQGRQQLWQLEAAPLDEARRSLERISQRWDEALGRLKAAVEDD